MQLHTTLHGLVASIPNTSIESAKVNQVVDLQHGTASPLQLSCTAQAFLWQELLQPDVTADRHVISGVLLEI
jgi:hypothetical protein